MYSLSFVNNDTNILSGFIDGSLILINASDMKIIKQLSIQRIYEQPVENQDPGNSVNLFFIIFVKKIFILKNFRFIQLVNQRANQKIYQKKKY